MDNQESYLEDIEPKEAEAGLFQRIFTNLFDWVIEVLIMIIVYFLLPKDWLSMLLDKSPFGIYVMVFILMFSYRLFSLIFFGKTLGMMICRVKYLNADLEPLTSKQKLIAVFATRTQKIRYYKSS